MCWISVMCDLLQKLGAHSENNGGIDWFGPLVAQAPEPNTCMALATRWPSGCWDCTNGQAAVLLDRLESCSCWLAHSDLAKE